VSEHTRMVTRAQERRAFALWLRRVDSAVGRICGLSHSDLPDISYYDLFRDEVAPEQAAREALEEAGFPADLLEVEE